VAFVKHLESLGAAVHLASLDVADADAVGAFLADFDAEGWPPIRSVFHAAALFGGEMLVDLQHDRLVEQLLPKLIGAWTLSEALDLDHLVLFSSLAAFLPVPGQSAYAASNTFLDALAAWREGQGRPGLSVNWGYWQDTEGPERRVLHATGDTAARGSANLQVTAPGTSGLRPELGLAALGRLLVDGRPRSIVAPIDWAEFAQARAVRPLAMTSELVAAVEESGADSNRHDATLAGELSACRFDDRQAVAETGLRRIVGGVLKMPAARIGESQPFGTLGLDSLMAIELRNKLEAEIGVKLSATVAWNYPTIRELGRFVLDKLALRESAADPLGQGVPSTDEERSDAADGAVAEVVALTDEAALAALLGEEGR
jgi:myxalamid-type polyketide synthase MxaE and MxaD